MSDLKKPQIARVTPYQDNDVVQVFGDNLDKDTVLYVWYNNTSALGSDIYLDDLLTDGMSGKKAELSALHTADSSRLGHEEENLPEVPPEDSIILYPDDVCERAIYFGEKAGPNFENGVYKRAKSSTAVMWLKNAAGFSAPYIANRPEIWNTSVKEIIPGGNISIYGGNFGEVVHFSDGTNFSKIGIIKNCETGEIIPLIGVMNTSYLFDAHKYTADFKIPENTPDGDYELFMHSGQCGIFGWSKGYKITVRKEYTLNDFFRTRWNRAALEELTMPECQVISIKAEALTPFADYADKIQQAIDALEDKGGIVYLDAGTFPISHEIIIKKNVVLLGSGKGTLIKAAQNKNFNCSWENVEFSTATDLRRGWANDWKRHFIDHNMHFAVRMEDHSGIESLSIDIGDGIDVGILVASKNSQIADKVFINMVDIDNKGRHAFELNGMSCATSAGILVGARTYELTIFSCNVTALTPIRIMPSRHTYAKIINNNFINRPRQFDESALCGLRHSIISNNLFENGRRGFVTNEGISHCWVFQNRCVDVNRAICALENFMSEHGQGEWSGKASAVGKNYIEIDTEEDIMNYTLGLPYNDRFDKFERFLFIIDGKGLGQYRKVIAVEEKGNVKRVILDSDWNVLPDADTGFTIVYGTHHNLWVDNSVQLCNGHSQFIWGCGFENIIAGHQMDVAAGIRLYASRHNSSMPDYTGQSIAVCAFNTIIKCQSRTSGMGLRMDGTAIRDIEDPKWDIFRNTRGIFGNCIKDCAFDGSESLLYAKNLHWDDEAYQSGIMIDGAYNRVVNNRIMGYETPVAICNDGEGNCFARNNYKGEITRFIGNGKPIGVDTKFK